MWVEYTSNPFRDDDGHIAGSVEVIRDVTEQIRLTRENVALRRDIHRQAAFGNIVTRSERMKEIFRLIERVSPTVSPVLITGESGTGKELVAKAVFANSDRQDAPFIAVNCGAIPGQLLESELFGHVKGAFTGAVKDHIGLIEAADQGTLFLDEIGDMPLPLQGKLLRFLQEGEIRRVGETRTRTFDVRIIAATNANLELAVQSGAFREDLFFRLSVIPIHIPSLCDRMADIPLLCDHLLDRLCQKHSRQVTGIASRVLKRFMACDWPGNIRELENVLEFALHLTDDGQAIQIDSLPGKFNTRQETEPDTGPLSIEAFIRQSIRSLETDHTETRIAEILGISRKNLWEKRKQLNLPRS